MEHHVVPQKIYLLIFVTLIMLTLVTVDVAFYNLGILSIYVALAIATTKATLVVLYFMHLKYSSRLNMIVVAAGVFGLIVLIALIAGDVFTRHWDSPPQGWSSIVCPPGFW